MAASRHRCAAAACALALAACGAPPSETHVPFEWTVAIDELDDAVLSVCSGGDRLLAVGGAPGRGLALEWDGEQWRGAALPPGSDLLWWCWIDGGGTALAVGERGGVLRSSDIDTWTREATDAIPEEVTLYGVWGAGRDDVHVVGGRVAPTGNESFAARFDGASWRREGERELPPQVLFKVWGTAADDVWLVGTEGATAHFDGSQWRRYETPNDLGLIAVWGTSPDDVYAVGGASGLGQILHFDGVRWSLFASAPERLSGVWTAPDRPLYVGGDRGYLARIDRGDPSRTEVAIEDSTVDVHSLAVSGRLIVACGADLQSAGDPSWRGAVFVHGGSLAGDVSLPPAPDAGAEIPDAGAADASPLPGPGQVCAPPPDVCAPGLDCWGLIVSDVYICTKSCATQSECFQYGAGACCAVPGFQTLQTVCIPAGYAECP